MASRAGDACAGWRAGAPVTHAALVARVRAWTALARRTSGGNVALFIEDSLEFAAALLGAWQAGKTVWLAADTLPGTCAALAASVDAFWGAYPLDLAPRVPGADDLCLLPWHAPAPAFAALVLHTSGSTGAPKAIPKQYVQLTSELTTLETQFGALVDGAAVLATVSHHHIYGLLFRVLWPLMAGRAIEAHGYVHPETLAPALAARPCVLVASPAQLKRLPPHLDWSGGARQLRAVFSSGGVLDADAAGHVVALLRRAPVEVYGSSETGGVAWRQRGVAAAWQPLPGVAWRIVAGQLQVLSAQAGGAWCNLADLAQADGTGFVLNGRSDRIVKIADKRIALDAIEAALCASGLAREARALVFSMPLPASDGVREAIAVFIVPTAAGQTVLDGAGKAALNARLRVALAGVVAGVALPRRWRYLDALPVNEQGKTTHAHLLALLA